MTAPQPKAAVPPSVRQAWERLTMPPQRRREKVKRRERVKLQTLRMASAIMREVELSWMGMSCMTPATMASGPMACLRRGLGRLEGILTEKDEDEPCLKTRGIQKGQELYVRDLDDRKVTTNCKRIVTLQLT